MADKVFISYSRKSDSVFAHRLAENLRIADIDVWIDQEIRTGSDWDRDIENAIVETQCLIVIMSPDSMASNNVRDEVYYAIALEKRILPILLIKTKNILLKIHSMQYIDFRTNKKAAFLKLLIDLGQVDKLNRDYQPFVEDEEEEKEIDKKEDGPVPEVIPAAPPLPPTTTFYSSTTSTPASPLPPPAAKLFSCAKPERVVEETHQSHASTGRMYYNAKSWDKAYVELRYALHLKPKSQDIISYLATCTTNIAAQKAEQIKEPPKYEWARGIGTVILVIIIASNNKIDIGTKGYSSLAFFAGYIIYWLSGLILIPQKKPAVPIDPNYLTASTEDVYYKDIINAYNNYDPDAFTQQLNEYCKRTRKVSATIVDHVSLEQFAQAIIYSIELNVPERIDSDLYQGIIDDLERGCQLEGSNCMYALGLIHKHGLYGKTDAGENLVKSVSYFKSAMQYCHPHAIYEMGLIYEKGNKIVAIDEEMAKQLFILACEKGNSMACRKLKD